MTFGRYTAADGATVHPLAYDPTTGDRPAEFGPQTVSQPADDRLRVLHITPYIIAGGVESWIRTLARAQQGRVRHAVVAPWAGESGLDMMEGVVDLYLPETNIDPYSAPALKWLGAFLRHRPEFDILHCTYHKGLYEVALADGRPRIVTVHSDGYRWLHEVKSPDRTVIISDWQGAMLPEWIRGPKREKIVNGIEVEGFAKPSGWAGYKEAYRSSFTYPRRDGQEPVVALWVGRLHKTKGLETLRAIAERWLPGAPNRHLAIVGQAHDEAVNVQMRKWMGQVERVSWIEYIEPEQMPWAYAAADIYLHTAPCEGFGLTVAEAQASGLPVVALEAPGVNEIVVHGETGSLSPLGGAEVDRLVGSLDYLAGDKRLRRRMGRAGQKRARELFTAERMGNEYLELYRWVASHSRGA